MSEKIRDDAFTGDAYPDLDETMAKGLIELALTRPRPMEDLLRKLGSLEADTWFPQSLKTGLGIGLDDPESCLLDGEAPLETLVSLKTRCKAVMAEHADADTKTQVTLAYFLVIAAALAHHDARISSQDREELASVLGELSRRIPGAWSRILKRAGATLETL